MRDAHPRVVIMAVAVVVLAAALTAAVAAGRGPDLVAPDEAGAFGFEPGELVVDFGYRALDGRRGRLGKLLDDHVAVVVFARTAGCPVSRRYGHSLAALEREYAAHGVAFLYVNASPQDGRDAARDEVATYGFEAPYVLDPEGDIAGPLQLRVSSEVVVIDRSGTLRYRGAVDDQHGIDFALPAPRQQYLRAALDAVLDHRPVPAAKTEASGCLFPERRAAIVPARPVDWHTRVSRIVQTRCVSCHRVGGVAPFSLETYEQASGFRAMIRQVVADGRMPPWFAHPLHGEWSNDRRLSDRDRRDLITWIDAGAPEGRAATAVEALAWVDGWQLDREPDAIFEVPEPEEVPASGVVDYRYVFVKTDFPEDRWIRAMEARPTAPDVTHHIIAYLQGPDDEERGPLLVGHAPGMPATVYPEGAAKRLPAGAWLMFELHYTPNGRPAQDRSRVGLIFADGPPDREVRTEAVWTAEFEIPPHAADHEVVAEHRFDVAGHILMFLPHMHLRGKAFRYEIDRADGSTEILLDVPRYDFNWQLWYMARQPVRVGSGDVLRGRARYDNSAANPANPDPTAAVRYGEQSFEEMMFGFFEWTPVAATERVGDEPASAP